MTKTKDDLADLVARIGITKKQALVAIDEIFDAIRAALKRGEKVAVLGFGTFLVKSKRARRGRNPRSGQEIAIPEKMQPVFRAGGLLKKEIKNAQNEVRRNGT